MEKHSRKRKRETEGEKGEDENEIAKPNTSFNFMLILQLPLELVFNVFIYLSSEDLCNLSLVLSRLNSHVTEFARHKIKGLLRCVKKSKNLIEYMEDEKRDENRLSKFSYLKQYCLLMKWRRLCRCPSKKINCDLIKENGIAPANIRKDFDQVFPGKYAFVIRLDVTQQKEIGTTISARWNDIDGKHERCVKLDKVKFEQLKIQMNGRNLNKRKFEQLKTQMDERNLNKLIDFEEKGYAFNDESGFLYFVIIDIYVATTCTVKLLLTVDEGRWKGSKYDYFELFPLDY